MEGDGENVGIGHNPPPTKFGDVRIGGHILRMSYANVFIIPPPLLRAFSIFLHITCLPTFFA